jgi:hypothetical protein
MATRGNSYAPAMVLNCSKFPRELRSGEIAAIVERVRQDGVGIIESAFDLTDVEESRRIVQDHKHLMKSTRPSPTSRHLAGFHRYPALEPVHQLITGNSLVRAVIGDLLGSDIRTIGLSDITMNRSQQWHKDLLRGSFRRFIEDENPCEKHHSKLFKVVLYMQDSSSLHVVPGSHRHDISLESDEYAVPDADAEVVSVKTKVGDAVVIDICTTHRGSPEEVFASMTESDTPRMLISTVFGSAYCDFADRIELGNAERTSVWQRMNR